MNLKNPCITVHNTDDRYWQITADGLIGDEDGMERISFSVLVLRNDHTGLPDLTRKAVGRAIALLQGYLDGVPARLQPEHPAMPLQAGPT